MLELSMFNILEGGDVGGGAIFIIIVVVVLLV